MNGSASGRAPTACSCSALVHELLKADKIDLDFLVRYTNAPWLVIDAPGTAEQWPVRARRGGRAALLRHDPQCLRLGPEAGCRRRS